MVMIGMKIPEFNLPAYINGEFKKIASTQLKGKWTVLFFYPLDFTFVCPTELRGFASRFKDFEKLNCQVIAASTDSEHSHKAWLSRDLPEVKYPIISDTSHHLSRALQVLKEDQGIAYRATFIVDPEGTIRYYVVSDLDVGRSVEETIRVLQGLQSGGLCPVDWKPGTKTLERK